MVPARCEWLKVGLYLQFASIKYRLNARYAANHT